MSGTVKRKASLKAATSTKDAALCTAISLEGKGTEKKRPISAWLIYLIISVVTAILVGFIFRKFGSVPLMGEKEPQEDPLLKKMDLALEGLKTVGFSTIVKVKDFGNGLGITTDVNVPKGGVLMTIPDSLVIEPLSEGPLKQVLEKDLMSGRITQLTAYLMNKVGLARVKKNTSESTSPLRHFVDLLPSFEFQKEKGLFSMDASVLNFTALGTNLEGMRDQADSEIDAALAYGSEPEVSEALGAGGAPTLEELRWAYHLLHSHGQSGLFNNEPRFLLPLFFARPTPELRDGVSIVRGSSGWQVLANQDGVKAGDEIYVPMPTVTDATLLAFRGQSLSSRHRMKVDVDIVPEPFTDVASMPILREWGCVGPQTFFIKEVNNKGASLDRRYLSCMRMIAASRNATRLRTLVQKTAWASDWPQTSPIGHKNEGNAAAIGARYLHSKFDRMKESMDVVVALFGKLTAEHHPTILVRDAEAVMLGESVKVLLMVQQVAKDPAMFMTYQELTARTKRSSEKSGPISSPPSTSASASTSTATPPSSVSSLGASEDSEGAVNMTAFDEADVAEIPKADTPATSTIRDSEVANETATGSAETSEAKEETKETLPASA